MKHIEYTVLRQTAGPRADVAASLGISERSLLRRENGEIGLTPEMQLAMETLAFLKTHMKFIPNSKKNEKKTHR